MLNYVDVGSSRLVQLEVKRIVSERFKPARVLKLKIEVINDSDLRTVGVDV
jgi:hypothetical protein